MKGAEMGKDSVREKELFHGYKSDHGVFVQFHCCWVVVVGWLVS